MVGRDRVDESLKVHWALIRALATNASHGTRAGTAARQNALRDLEDWGYAVRTQEDRGIWLPTSQGVTQFYRGPWKIE